MKGSAAGGCRGAALGVGGAPLPWGGLRVRGRWRTPGLKQRFGARWLSGGAEEGGVFASPGVNFAFPSLPLPGGRRLAGPAALSGAGREACRCGRPQPGRAQPAASVAQRVPGVPGSASWAAWLFLRLRLFVVEMPRVQRGTWRLQSRVWGLGQSSAGAGVSAVTGLQSSGSCAVPRGQSGSSVRIPVLQRSGLQLLSAMAGRMKSFHWSGSRCAGSASPWKSWKNSADVFCAKCSSSDTCRLAYRYFSDRPELL